MSIWTDEMKSAAMQDAQKVNDLHNAARFLIDRLREFEGDLCDCRNTFREWNGHVVPALVQMELLTGGRFPQGQIEEPPSATRTDQPDEEEA